MKKVYLILGCTACGKGAVARQFARQVGGQIISVDSMKIYRRMDIGTAKPSAEIRAEIPHHCVDLVEPSDNFTVADYVRHADAAIESILAAGFVPVAVGGTSLYIKALTEGLFEGPQAPPEVRQALKDRAHAEGLTALHAELARVDPEAAERIHRNDERRIVRALEVFQATGQPISKLQSQWDAGQQRHNCVLVGLRRPKEELNHRVNLRVKKMVDMGLADEVKNLLAEPKGLSLQAAQAVGYAELIRYFRGHTTLAEAFEQVKINTRQLAKKQRTWHRRWTDVIWFDLALDETPEQTVERILAAVPLTK